MAIIYSPDGTVTHVQTQDIDWEKRTSPKFYWLCISLPFVMFLYLVFHKPWLFFWRPFHFDWFLHICRVMQTNGKNLKRKRGVLRKSVSVCIRQLNRVAVAWGHVLLTHAGPVRPLEKNIQGAKPFHCSNNKKWRKIKINSLSFFFYQ